MNTLNKTIEFAADLETPVSAYLKLGPLSPVFLLESVERNEMVGRFSFIGIQPKEFYVLNDLKESSSFFREIQTRIAGLPSNHSMRFSSGLVGFFSYNASAFLHPHTLAKQSRFPLAGFVLPSAVLIFDHLKRRLLLSSILNEREEVSLAQEIQTCLHSVVRLPKSGKSAQPGSLLSRDDFCSMVEQAKDHISKGDIFQAVLSMQFDGDTDAEPFQMYRALRMINPSPYMFFLNFQDRFQFFGSSPETMVRTERATDGLVRTILRPIAGTRRRGKEKNIDELMEKELLDDAKERAEHLMLLDLARNDLGRICRPGSIQIPEFMKVEKYSHVMHLVSTVEGMADQSIPLHQLFAATFPAGTVTGAPKIRAMQIIHKLEPHDRGLYAGSLGYFSSNGEVDHCIAIRCVVREGNRYQFTTGAGIVADSTPEREYDEITGKAMALRTMLKMAEDPL